MGCPEEGWSERRGVPFRAKWPGWPMRLGGILFFALLDPESAAKHNGGGGGSRTRVRNRCQPGEFMLCPLPHVFASYAQNGQDAHKASPIDLASAARTEPLPPAC